MSTISALIEAMAAGLPVMTTQVGGTARPGARRRERGYWWLPAIRPRWPP
jgi:glycosyltransferase involved in cell wall biosynthesis